LRQDFRFVGPGDLNQTRFTVRVLAMRGQSYGRGSRFEQISSSTHFEQQLYPPIEYHQKEHFCEAGD
jgi:hypothetical protein